MGGRRGVTALAEKMVMGFLGKKSICEGRRVEIQREWGKLSGETKPGTINCPREKQSSCAGAGGGQDECSRM